MAIGRACKFGHLPWWAWLICFRSMLPESGAETHPTSVASEWHIDVVAAVRAKYTAKMPA